MKLIGFRTPKPRKYSYKPVFFDPVKELQEIHNNEQSESIQKRENDIRLRLRFRSNRKIHDEQARKRKRRMSILFSLLLLLILLYYIFF